jgi:hypothetical protein
MIDTIDAKQLVVRYMYMHRAAGCGIEHREAGCVIQVNNEQLGVRYM